MEALKASWTVVAGVIPGTPMKEYSKGFYYTSKDKEADYAAIDADPHKQPATNIFTERMKEAHDYSLQIHDPRYVNWVRVEFIWY